MPSSHLAFIPKRQHKDQDNSVLGSRLNKTELLFQSAGLPVQFFIARCVIKSTTAQAKSSKRGILVLPEAKQRFVSDSGKDVLFQISRLTIRQTSRCLAFFRR